jgi:hypothetical protein
MTRHQRSYETRVLSIAAWSIAVSRAGLLLAELLARGKSHPAVCHEDRAGVGPATYPTTAERSEADLTLGNALLPTCAMSRLPIRHFYSSRVICVSDDRGDASLAATEAYSKTSANGQSKQEASAQLWKPGEGCGMRRGRSHRLTHTLGEKRAKLTVVAACALLCSLVYLRRRGVPSWSEALVALSRIRRNPGETAERFSHRRAVAGTSDHHVDHGEGRVEVAAAL